MSQDIERRLERLIPDGPDPGLRSRVLAAVGEELTREPGTSRRRWRFRPGLAAAAALMAGLGLNLWVDAELDRRLARVLGPPPVSRRATELASDIAAVSDEATGSWAFRRLSERSPLPPERPYAARLRELVRQLTAESKESVHEAPEDRPEVDRHLRGRLDRDPAAGERVLRLELRNRA